ncbi:HTH_48 domain-containing protein [Trichonephila clavata]|uniref:HTH_48 domain-containing protein n=1 Tax=Trichonephila clavata TaxID=2740835 RepID=A0A8X6M1P4_TRICU|nr:HTH_48 domain-containing protein [Trichonephila clavata]
MEVIRVEQRAFIKISVLRGKKEMECHSEFVKALGNNALPYHTVALGNNALPYHTVARWVAKFQQERMSTSDKQRSGLLLNVRTDLTCAVIEQLMDEDRRWMLLELESASGIEKRTTNASSCHLYLYCVVFLLHREGRIALCTAVIN